MKYIGLFQDIARGLQPLFDYQMLQLGLSYVVLVGLISHVSCQGICSMNDLQKIDCRKQTARIESLAESSWLRVGGALPSRVGSARGRARHGRRRRRARGGAHGDRGRPCAARRAGTRDSPSIYNGC